MRTVCAVVCIWAGCYAPRPAAGVPCGPNDACPLGQRCGPDGRCGGLGDAAIVDEVLADAGIDVMIAFTPSNDVSPGVLAGVSQSITGTTTILIDTDSGEIVTNGMTTRAAGLGLISGIRFDQTTTLGIFATTGLDVSTGATLRGRGTRALILFVTGDAVVSGAVNVSAGTCTGGTLAPACGGPGGGNGGMNAAGTGCGPGGKGVNNGDTGGGGGALGQAGAAGGQETDENMMPGGAAGVLANCPGPTLEPLVGGSAGGAGGGGAAGGGGGGALQITALGTITVSGKIISSGEGGRGSLGGGGGGGGAGGAILLEAPSVVVTGATLAANGGGGGAGQSVMAGEAGRESTSAALGGAGGRTGGNGGCEASLPTSGTTGVNDTGGGGGGAGRIRINATTVDSSTAAVTSPAATVSSLQP